MLPIGFFGACSHIHINHTYIERESGRLEFRLEELHVHRNQSMIEESDIDERHVLVAENAQISIVRLDVEHELQLLEVFLQCGPDDANQILPAELVRNAMGIDREIEENGLHGHYCI